MKKLFLILSLLMLPLCSFAANVGFQDDSVNKINISQALKMADDSYVTVQGSIVKKISEDKYLFKDSTATITVEIDKDKWNGQSVNINDKLELTGEIEKKYNSTILDVDTLKIISK